MITYTKWLKARGAHKTGNLWQCCNFHKNLHPSLPPSLPASLPACWSAGRPTDPPTYLYLQYPPSQFHRDIPMLYVVIFTQNLHPSLPPSLPACPPAGRPTDRHTSTVPTYLYLQYLPTEFHRELPMLYEIL